MSISRYALNDISEFRNPEIDQCPNPLKVLVAEVALIIIIPFALVEAALANIARIFTLLPFSHKTSDKIHSWGSSSAYALILTLAALISNLCFKILKPLPAPAEDPQLPGDPTLPSTTETIETSIHTSSAEKIRALVEGPQTTEELKNTRNAFGISQIEEKNIYDEAIQWREIHDALVSNLPSLTPQTNRIDVPRTRHPQYRGCPPPANYEKMAGSALDPKRKELYNRYKLAKNATKISDVLERMFARLPIVSEADQLQLVDVLIPNFLEREVSKDEIPVKLTGGSAKWQDRTVRMLWAIFQEIPKITSPDEVEVLRQLMTEGFKNCSNRMSTEVERLYFKYVERSLMGQYEASLSGEECLIYELNQYRMDIRDLVINTECHDNHNAASHNYFRRELNDSIFHLPQAPLSGEDPRYDLYAMKEKQDAVIAGFNQLYNNEQVIKHFEQMIVNDGKAKKYKYTPQMFTTWLETSNRMNADVFEDDGMTKYKPEVIVAFLEEHQFISRKA
jgi:hypothetical protein